MSLEALTIYRPHCFYVDETETIHLVGGAAAYQSHFCLSVILVAADDRHGHAS